MKLSYSTKWKKSEQIRKQRKYVANAPYHITRKFLAAPLSKELQKKHSVKTLSIRTEDKVKIKRGQFKGQSGKVERIELSKLKIFVTGIERLKKDGNKVLVGMHPSNVQIIELKDDKRRIAKNKKAKTSQPSVVSSKKPSVTPTLATPKKEASQ